jgi:hypothetical protein
MHTQLQATTLEHPIRCIFRGSQPHVHVLDPVKNLVQHRSIRFLPLEHVECVEEASFWGKRKVVDVGQKGQTIGVGRFLSAAG